MGLSTATVATLKACGPILQAHKQAVGQTFYKNLFREHPELRSMFNMSNQEAQAGALSGAVVAFCQHGGQVEALASPIAKIIQRHVALDVRPEQYSVVGNTLLDTLEEVLGKETFSPPVKTAVAEGYFYLADLLVAEEGELNRKRRETKGGWQGWKQFRMTRKEKETSLHTSFYFLPADGGTPVTFQAGQYITVRLQPPGSDHPVVRSYSLTGTGEAGEYRITVKREEKGLVSSFLHKEMQPGDVLEVTAPAGDFILMPGPEAQVFIGAGTGITPLYSMMKEAAAQPDTQGILLYRAHHAHWHPLKSKLLSLLSSSPNLSAVFQYTGPESQQQADMARVSILPPAMPWDVDTLASLLPGKECKAYVCGPTGFTQATLDNLKTAGVKEDGIFHECFGPQT